MSAPTSPTTRRTPADTGAVPALLAASLQLAVPMHLWELADLDPDRIRDLAPDCAQTIAEHGDDLQYGGPACAKTFNALARGLALLAHCPGGVTFAGLHWCTTAHPHCPNRPAPPEEEHR